MPGINPLLDWVNSSKSPEQRVSTPAAYPNQIQASMLERPRYTETLPSSQTSMPATPWGQAAETPPSQNLGGSTNPFSLLPMNPMAPQAARLDLYGRPMNPPASMPSVNPFGRPVVGEGLKQAIAEGRFKNLIGDNRETLISQWGWKKDANGRWVHPETGASGYWDGDNFVNASTGQVFRPGAYSASADPKSYLTDHPGFQGGKFTGVLGKPYSELTPTERALVDNRSSSAYNANTGTQAASVNPYGPQPNPYTPPQQQAAAQGPSQQGARSIPQNPSERAQWINENLSEQERMELLQWVMQHLQENQGIATASGTPAAQGNGVPGASSYTAGGYSVPRFLRNRQTY